eukprot:scaffold451_cov184-Amphora_coffeaeformis.AAC.9
MMTGESKKKDASSAALFCGDIVYHLSVCSHTNKGRKSPSHHEKIIRHTQPAGLVFGSLIMSAVSSLLRRSLLGTGMALIRHAAAPAGRRRVGPPTWNTQVFASQQRRSMSMFLWRHVPVYCKDTENEDKNDRKRWRLNKHQTKPAKPVRVEAFRPLGLPFKRGVITPDGVVHPYQPPDKKGKHKHINTNNSTELSTFQDYYMSWVERWQQQRDYQDARGIPETRYCPRCDEPMHWLGKKPAKWLYTPVVAKRRMYDRINLEQLRDEHGIQEEEEEKGFEISRAKEEDEEEQDEIKGAKEDRYCCPNDECGIREARFVVERNTARIEILEGLTNKQWHPTKFRAGAKGKEKSARAKERLAAIPFENRGIPLDKEARGPHDDPAPYKNGVSHEKALEIVGRKARARYEARLKGDLAEFTKRPNWYKIGYNFSYAIYKQKEKEAKEAITPTNAHACDECGEGTDKIPSVCFQCGFLLCKKCRLKHFPTNHGIYQKHGQCPGCRRAASNSLDMMDAKNRKRLGKLVEQNPHDPRRYQWKLILNMSTSLLSRRNSLKKIRPHLVLEMALASPPNKLLKKKNVDQTNQA